MGSIKKCRESSYEHFTKVTVGKMEDKIWKSV